MGERTKRLTIGRSLELLQMEYGTQVREVRKVNNSYYADRILGEVREFTRDEILKIEDNIYNNFGY